MKLEGAKINFLGDSITEGVGTSNVENVFHAVLKRNAGLAEARNYGIGGTRFALQTGTPQRPKDNWVDINSFCERFDKMDDDADAVEDHMDCKIFHKHLRLTAVKTVRKLCQWLFSAD